MRHTFFIFILMLSCAVYGQTIWVEGSIIDSKDGQSLPYATVKSSSGESTICNENGIFKIQTSNKAAQKRIDSSLADLSLAYRAHIGLLEAMTHKTFSVASYLKAKQETLLDAMEERKIRKRKRQSK